MSRYIDAEKLEQRLRVFSDWCRDDRKDGVDFVLNGVLADTPTADVQEVLRCKDCKFYKVFSGIGHCGVLGICEPDDFCCRGERRKDNGETDS